MRPEYRVRLFLSVDLAGSTAYKSRQKTILWIRTFEALYARFQSILNSTFLQFCEKHPECGQYIENPPRLWKTVGDEIIFANRINSLFHLFACVHSFDIALGEYKTVLHLNEETTSLDVKGNGWLASFPYPNQTVRKNVDLNSEAEISVPDEADEKAADETPSSYEFLGPGIDSGFRIARNSSPALFTVSPALAHALCRANTNRDYSAFKFDLVYKGVNSLKGVIDGDEYPIVGVRTERDPSLSRLASLRDPLDGTPKPNSSQLIEYLESFMSHHQIEAPIFGSGAPGGEVAVPDFYETHYVPEWHRQNNELQTANENLRESETVENGADQDESASEAIKEVLRAFLEAAVQQSKKS
ncbi:MAG: hypothetical protein AAFY65_09455 [Pseudomonadota bacterium]